MEQPVTARARRCQRCRGALYPRDEGRVFGQVEIVHPGLETRRDEWSRVVVEGAGGVDQSAHSLERAREARRIVEVEMARLGGGESFGVSAGADHPDARKLAPQELDDACAEGARGSEHDDASFCVRRHRGQASSDRHPIFGWALW